MDDNLAINNDEMEMESEREELFELSKATR
jgi:hypothetical protein